MAFSAIILLCAVSEPLVQDFLAQHISVGLGFWTLLAIARLPFILCISLCFAYVLECKGPEVSFFKKAGYIVIYPAVIYFIGQLFLSNGSVLYEAPVFYVVLAIICQLSLRSSFFAKKNLFTRWLLLSLVGLLLGGVLWGATYSNLFTLPPSINIPSGEELL